MEGPPLGPGWENITWPHQVAPRGRKASSTRKIKPQTSNLIANAHPLSNFDRSEDLFLLSQHSFDRALVTPFAHHGAMSYVQPVFN